MIGKRKKDKMPETEIYDFRCMPLYRAGTKLHLIVFSGWSAGGVPWATAGNAGRW
jgi:hypothetical protein